MSEASDTDRNTSIEPEEQAAIREALISARLADGESRTWETAALSVVAVAIALTSLAKSADAPWLFVPVVVVSVLAVVGFASRRKYAAKAVDQQLLVELLLRRSHTDADLGGQVGTPMEYAPISPRIGSATTSERRVAQTSKGRSGMIFRLLLAVLIVVLGFGTSLAAAVEFPRFEIVQPLTWVLVLAVAFARGAWLPTVRTIAGAGGSFLLAVLLLQGSYIAAAIGMTSDTARVAMIAERAQVVGAASAALVVVAAAFVVAEYRLRRAEIDKPPLVVRVESMSPALVSTAPVTQAPTRSDAVPSTPLARLPWLLVGILAALVAMRRRR